MWTTQTKLFNEMVLIHFKKLDDDLAMETISNRFQCVRMVSIYLGLLLEYVNDL